TNGSPFEFQPITDGQYHEYCLNFNDVPARWWSSWPNFGAGVNGESVTGMEIFINSNTAPVIVDSIWMDDIEAHPRPTMSMGMFDDFECDRNVEYVYIDGPANDHFTNPGPTAVNNSMFCMEYLRNSAVQYDVIVGNFASNIDLTSMNQLMMDVATPDTSHTFQITLQNVNGATRTDLGLAFANATTTNSWETIAFDFSALQNASNVNGFVILANPNAFTGDTYLIDNFRQGLGIPTASISPASGMACEGDSVWLSAPSMDGATYAWLMNGMAIAGAMDSMYAATASGNYQVIMTGPLGSDTSSMSMVTLTPGPTGMITMNGNDLTCSAASSYQWYMNGMMIAGATMQMYTASTNGDYHCVITDSMGCTGSSDTVSFAVGIQQGLAGNLNIFPNPTENQVNIAWTTTVGDRFELDLLDAMGRRIQQIALDALNGRYETTLDMSALPAGVYFVRINGQEGSITKPLMKQ
ncbi:MAG: T9SS type A sorting domain-containing protein, partial [Bacteroidota bacterium]